MSKKTKEIISYQKPPQYRLIKALFPAYDFQTTVMTWGGTIYSSTELPEQTMAHELIHVKQQMGKNKWLFLIRFWLSPKFRLKMELEAYREEWRVIKEKWPRDICSYYGEKQDRFLNRMAENLSSPLYKNLVSTEKAKRLIMGLETL